MDQEELIKSLQIQQKKQIESLQQAIMELENTHATLHLLSQTNASIGQN
jgi:hypothetical protein